ncbi:spore cortex-lytic enzyme [Paenibacillus baekrokdamisoli]|uniref:Spore cortex-lytic enzyme n=1 Tax=Paenibacillus baekrokdamisoli TaxID=1712516 RepID=A0A3G9IPK7_9BACL|nr:cell wall hydrolase [Paenibacillus baekrokdamisoli]MBB3071991.1 N-acetylmuramoyl-L-alanine amidase [Paenibacillus baekrokdamisoli]BBH20296.1 spore cortex-lytic enzyme [Paenibacillus baekrokdamisoli]
MFRRLSVLVLLLVLATLVTTTYYAEAQTPATLKFGSTGPDVPDLQFRLQTMGYFKSPITTTFGMTTRTALQNFQYANGIAKDGIAGPKTWRKLKKLSVNKPELSKLARIIYSEARGEIYAGQVAVGAVVMNRLQSSNFPNTLTGVIMEPHAFTAVADGQYWLLPDPTAFQAARDAVKGWDPSGNALFYYNPNTATSDWVRSLKIIKKIGNHVFAK